MNASGRGSNNDAATTTGAHGWDGILEPEPDTAHVDGYDLIEDVNGVVGNGLYHAFDSGVGEQNVVVSLNCRDEVLPRNTTQYELHKGRKSPDCLAV